MTTPAQNLSTPPRFDKSVWGMPLPSPSEDGRPVTLVDPTVRLNQEAYLVAAAMMLVGVPLILTFPKARFQFFALTWPPQPGYAKEWLILIICALGSLFCLVAYARARQHAKQYPAAKLTLPTWPLRPGTTLELKFERKFPEAVRLRQAGARLIASRTLRDQPESRPAFQEVALAVGPIEYEWSRVHLPIEVRLPPDAWTHSYKSSYKVQWALEVTLDLKEHGETTSVFLLEVAD